MDALQAAQASQPVQDPTATQRYQYGSSYQMKILALLVRYQNFIHKYGEVVRPEYFEYETMSTLCRLIIEFYRRYMTQPAYETFVVWVTDWATKYHVPEKTRQEILNTAYSIFSIDMSDGDAVRDTAIEFARRQALKQAVMQVADLLDKYENYDRAQSIINQALMTGQGVGNLGLEAYSTFSRLPGLIAAEGPYAIHRKVATPFPSLNEARYGGLGAGECMIIVGSSGQGKSIIMNNCLALAVQQNPNSWGAHATLELSEVDNILRYASRILNIDQVEIVQGSHDFQQRVMQVTANNRIFVKWFPPMGTTVQHIRSWISTLTAEMGCGPCAIVIDYPDLMAPSKPMGNTYQDVGSIYSEIIVLLKDYGIPGFFNSQLDRYHQYSNDARGSNMANSIAKFYHADVVGTINQSEEDKQRGMARIWWDKCRRGRDAFYTYFRINYPRALVFEDADVAGMITQDRPNSRRAPQPAVQ